MGLSLLILTGCFNPVAVSIVEDMYTEALLEDEARIAPYFSEAYLSENPIDELSEEVVQHVRNVGGTKLLNTAEVPRNRLNSDIVAELDKTYEDDWFYIALDAGEDEIMTWVVIKTSTHYEIVDGEKISIATYNDEVLK